MLACRVRVYVDERERGSGVPEALQELGVAIIFQQLGVGDYVVSDRVAVERKTIEDLAKSVFDGRLFDQARRLSEYYEMPIILVEGNLSELERVTGRSFQVRMALLAVSIDYGIRVAYSSSPSETAKILASLARREQCESRRAVVVHRKPRFEKLWMQQLYVVQSFPGIGPRLAEKLLEKFGSIEAICKASIVELERVIGYERAKKLYQIIHAKFSKPCSGNG